MSLRISILVVLLLQLGTNLHAQKRFQPVESRDLFTLNNSEGEPVQCWENNQGVFRFAKIRERKGRLQVRVVNYRKRIRKIRDRVRNSNSKRRRRKLRQRIKSLRATFKENNALCALGPFVNPIDPTGTPTPVPTPDFYDLTPLKRSLTLEDVRYLAEKAAFGLGPNEQYLIDAASSGGIESLVDSLLAVREEREDLMEDAEKLLDNSIDQDRNRVYISGIQQAWLTILLESKNPFHERFAWFLMSLWTVGTDTFVGDEQKFMMWDYINRLRTASLEDSSVVELGKQITIDPLMLQYLSGDGNSAENPNENYARELLELFTVGPKDLDGNPNYTELGGDITQLSQALTGWQVEKVSGQWIRFFNPEKAVKRNITVFAGTPHECLAARQYDPSNSFSAVECAFGHPQAPIYYAKEILRFFLTEDPPRELIENFAEVIRENGWELHKSMEVLFMSKAFHHSSYKNSVVKDSVHSIVEFFRTIDLPVTVHGNNGMWSRLNRHQPMTSPPTVFWWPEEYHSSPPTLIEKHNTVVHSLRARRSDSDWTLSGKLPAEEPLTVAEIVRTLSQLFDVELSDDDLAQIEFYMNNRRLEGGTYEELAYDHSDPEHRRLKIPGLVTIFFMHPAFQSA